jgi:hypothetical protein
MISNVYILQSLRSKDPIRCGNVLAGRLRAVLPVDFVDVPDATKLFGELQRIKTAIVNLSAPAVIHFHCHGNESGIGLHDEHDQPTLVTWENFRAIFRDIYLTAPVKPLISFCSCKGLNIMQLIAQYEPCPYETIAGCLEEIGFQASIDAFYIFYAELHAGTTLVDAVVKVVTKFPALKFFAAPVKVLAELAWTKYKQNLTTEEIQRRKTWIISEIVAIQGGIFPEQIAQLDASLTPDSGERDQQRHSQIFNT